ncbi:MAG: choice-of-anchor Q domain-containing protein [Marinicella sp.]
MNNNIFRTLIFASFFSVHFLNIANAGAILVDTISDQPQPGFTTLREAIELANNSPGQLIGFDASLFSTPQTIVLENGELVISAPMTIFGPGADLLTIDADEQSRVFDINAPNTLAEVGLSGMTLFNGSVTGPGGCINNREQLSLRSVRVAGCHATANGGGMHSFQASQLLIEDSHFFNNSSGNDGGGMFAQNGLNNQILNSTFSDNLANRSGGGVLIQQVFDFTVANSTFSGNSASTGAGIQIPDDANIIHSTIVFNFGGGLKGEQDNVQNSIIAGNTLTDCAFDNTGFNNQNNLDSDGSCGLGASNHLTAADPGLTSLSMHGGPTPVHMPKADSPAVDTGDEILCLGIDQRGINRPQDGDDNGSTLCDIGAVERQLFEDIIFNSGFEF